jgi:hypothetical protein
MEFNTVARRLGLTSAVATVVLVAAYAVTLTVGLAALKSPDQPIANPMLAPSTSVRTGTHPLEDLVSKVVVGSGTRYAPLLTLGASAAAHRGFATDRFAVSAAPAGRTVLIIDDTWTTGSHAQ